MGNLGPREKMLYLIGGGIVVTILIFGGLLMVTAFRGGNGADSENTESTNESETQQSSFEQSTEKQQQSTSQLPTWSPTPLLQEQVVTVTKAGDSLLYVTKDGEVYRISASSGDREELATLDLVNPAYVYLPPVSSPKFVVVKDQGIYKVVRIDGEESTAQLPSDVEFVAVNHTNQTIYGLVNRGASDSRIIVFELNGTSRNTLLARPGISRLEFAGNNLFYTADGGVYEYDLGNQKEHTILEGEEGGGAEISWALNGAMYVGVIKRNEEHMLYRFAEEPRTVQTLSVDIDPRFVVWSEREQQVHYLKGDTLHTLSLQSAQKLSERPVSLNDVEIDSTAFVWDSTERPVFVSMKDRYLYRLVGGI